MKNISSLFLGMAILCSFGSVLAQSNTSLPIFNTCEEATQYAFRDLDQTKITKGILYDRVFKNAHLELFQSAENSHAGHWKQAYFELYHASNNNSQMLNSDNLDNLIYESYESTLTVTLGVLAAEFNVLNYDAVETTSTGSPYRLKSGYNSNQIYLEKEVMVVAPLIDEIPMGTTNFSLPRWATISFGTNYVTSISVNFGDGNPIRNFYPGSIINQYVTYNTAGEKKLEFTVYMNNGTLRTAKATLEVSNTTREDNTSSRVLSYPRPDNISIVDSSDIWATIAFQGYDESYSFKGYGQYLTYFAAGRTRLTKPIIIIDGFDPADGRSARFVYEQRLRYFDNGDENIGEDFRRNTPGNSYDVIVLNLPKYEYISSQHQVCDPRSNRCYTVTVKDYRNGGGDYIERNAFVLVELIKRVNQQLEANGSTEKITIFGPSMGGLITRYALSYMEKNNLNANCKLWVSFDVPHLGANVNLGLQYTLDLMKSISKGAKDAQKLLLDAPAARQMLIQHYRGEVGEQVSGDPVFHTRFLQAMSEIGFPQAACLRKVALNNGSKNGVFQNFSPCADVMKITMKARPDGANMQFCWPIGFIGRLFGVKKLCEIPHLEVRASTAPSSYNRCLIARRYFLGINGDNGDVYVRGNEQPSADLIPGSYQNIFSQLTEKAKREKWFYGVYPEVYFTQPTFVPTFSSYALKSTNPNWGASLNSINIQTDTPFDAIYAPEQNEEHTELTKAGVDFIRAQLALADQQCQPPHTSLPLTNGCYSIVAKHSNKLMQPENNNTTARIRQYNANGQTNQKFRLETVNEAYYKITNLSSGKVWEYDGIANGTGITQGNWANGNFQRWNLAAWGDGTFKIEANHAPGQLADVEGISTGDGAGLHLWASHGGHNQRYTFRTVSCNTSPPINANGLGLTGIYFNNKNLSGSPVFNRLDETVNFTWGGDGPGNGIGNDNFSVRWEGQLEAPFSGNVTFKINNDDGTRLWVNGQLLIDNWVDQAPTWKTGVLSLAAGQRYDLKMEYYENGGGAQAQLFWEYPGQSEQIIPKSNLFPLIGCLAPAPPVVSANPMSVNSGEPSQLNASGCPGTITWSHGLSGNPVEVHPTTTTTYLATCTVNGCSSSSSVTVDVGTNNNSACDCGFTLLSASQNSGQYMGSFQFSSCSVYQINWSLLNGNSVIASGAENVTAAVVPFAIPASVNTGDYTLKVDVVNCTGTGTTAFNYTKPGGNISVNCNTLNGHFDGAGCGTLGGWAYDYSNPSQSINVDIMEGNTVIQANVPAANFRQDLLNAGLGNGIHGFEIYTPNSLKNGQSRSLSVRVTGCNYILNDSPRTINCASGARMYAAMETSEVEAVLIYESATNEGLYVLPNPNNGVFEVRFDLDMDQKATLLVFEISGKVIYEQKLIGKGKHQEKVVLADHVSGIYLVELWKPEGLTVKKTLVIK